MNLSKKLMFMAGTAMFLSSVTLVAAGQNTATASTKTVPTPKATELLMQSYQYLGSLDKYSFEAEQSIPVLMQTILQRS